MIRLLHQIYWIIIVHIRLKVITVEVKDLNGVIVLSSLNNASDTYGISAWVIAQLYIMYLPLNDSRQVDKSN